MNEQANEQINSEETVAQAAPADLNLNDLMMIKNLIDVVTTRGAFKANELSSVGVLYDKLEKFLASVSAQQQTPAAPQGE
jgi:hypothetical protein